VTAAVLLAGLAGVFLGGLGFAILLSDSNSRRLLTAERIGLAAPLGIAATSGAMFVWSLAGGRLTAGVSRGLCAAGIVFGFAVLWKARRRLLADTNLAVEVAGQRSALAALCRAIIALLIIGTFVLTLMTPQRFWDERAIFGIKSKVLFTDGTIDSPALRHPDFVQGHPRYPLLLPLAETHVYLLLGRIDDRWSKAVLPLLFAGLVLTYAGVLSRRFGNGFGWLFGLLLASLPLLAPYELGFIAGQADAPVACYHGLAVLHLWDLLWPISSGGDRTERSEGVIGFDASIWRRGILIGVLAAAAAFTKDEGIAHLLVGGIALLMTWGWNRITARRSASANVASVPISTFLKLAGTIAVTCAVLLAPWFWHRRTLPITNEMQYFARLSAGQVADHLAALNWLVPHLVSRLFREWSTWGLQWWLLVVAAVTVPGRLLRPAQVFVLLEIAGSLAALIVAGMIAPAELHDHIGGSSHRYLMQLAPLAVLFAAGQWGPNDGGTRNT
jgi:hypothetical protein